MFENVNVTLSLLLAIAPALLALLEHFIKKGKPFFLLLNALYFGGACVILFLKEGTIACLLIAAAVSLCMRLFIEIWEGGKNK